MDTTKRISFLNKVITCFIAGVTLAYPAKRINEDYLPIWLPNALLPATVWFVVAGCFLFLFIWQILEKRNKINSLAALAFMQGIIIYSLAFFFTKWGLLKILRLHMTTSLGWMDMPTSALSGEQQLSHFFGQSYPMVVCLGIFEIAGAVLILFRRTRLLGAFILITLVFNIILIDFLYDVNVGVFIESCILLSGLSYLMFQDFSKIKNFFFTASNHLPGFNFKSKLFKNIIKLSAILIPFFILFPNYTSIKHPALIGKYEVQNLIVNGKNVVLNPCSDSIVSHIYFDLNEDFFFSYNHFNRLQIGSLKFDENTRQLEGIWRYPKNLHDTLYATLSKLNKENKMKLEGTMGKDTLQIELSKQKVKSLSYTY